MAKLLGTEFITEKSCPYLEDRTACLEYRYLSEVTAAEMDAMLERGWRRFGIAYFRPVCAACNECVSLRIPVSDFLPSKSQRRVLRRCADVEVRIGKPVIDEARLAIYRSWHGFREKERGWRSGDLSAQSYAWLFCYPHPCAREMSYCLNGQLIAVGIVDETSTALSSVYFYYDPAFARLSLGTYSALCEVDYARRQGLKHVYLGYRVSGCPSVAYKAQFRPHETLTTRPEPVEIPAWSGR